MSTWGHRGRTAAARLGVPAGEGEGLDAGAPPVLVLAQGWALNSGAEARLRDAAGVFGWAAVHVLRSPTWAQLRAGMGAGTDSLLLLDVQWAQAQDELLLDNLRREFAGRVMLLWTDERSEWLGLALRCDARGALAAADEPFERLDRAVREVRGGRLWFSRGFLQRLYETVRDEREGLTRGSDRHAPATPAGGLAVPRALLTPRERDVYRLMRAGLSNKQIGAELGISINTVKKHLAAAFAKTGLRHRRQARI